MDKIFVAGSDFQNWIMALLTLAILSILYKENPVYRFAEHLFVGTSVGYSVMTAWFTYGKPTIMKSIIAEGKWTYIFPVLIGLLIYTRYIKNIAWLSRYCIGFIIGYGSAYVLTRDPRPLVLTQAVATFKPLWVAGDLFQTFSNWVLVLGVAGTLTYFFFTSRRTGVIGAGATIGKWVMMVAFGSAFGNTVMARISLFLGRMQFLLGKWLHVIPG
ncbi:MAG: hypothetical protein Q8P50_16935 [Bacillota bacterium]|nr:hypothetical protein [Bacillota bacterium]